MKLGSRRKRNPEESYNKNKLTLKIYPQKWRGGANDFMYDFLYSFSNWKIPNFKIIWLFQRIKKEEITFRSVFETIDSDTKTREKILYKMLMNHSFIPRIKRYLKIRKFINVTHHLTIQSRKTIKLFYFWCRKYFDKIKHLFIFKIGIEEII